MARSRNNGVLSLKSGEWVEVRSREEILATLDERGRLENLPFMPEMFAYCGQRFQVFKRADKTCDNIATWSIRRMKHSVHLQGSRCDGSGHDGCEAGCLIFWKEAWLKRADNSVVPFGCEQPAPRRSQSPGLCTVESILAASVAPNAAGAPVYSCQATELRKFTSHMKSWDPRQYVRDLLSGNVSTGLAGDTWADRVLEFSLGVIHIFRAVLISLYNAAQARHNGYHIYRYPVLEGTLKKTPLETLELQPGELVQVRSKEEIVATLDKNNRNRGLLFDSEMLRYCGGIYRVLRRVHHIIDEKTGKMMDMKNPCIVLEGVYCQSDYHRLCPRAIYSYWRENWLTRVSDAHARELASGEEKVGAYVR